jgi:hypothetical protein
MDNISHKINFTFLRNDDSHLLDAESDVKTGHSRFLSHACKVRVKVRITLRLAVYRQSVRLVAKPLETHGHNFFQLNPCDRNPYVTSSLMRGWVCRLQLLLTLASTVILGSVSRGTHNLILSSQIRDFPNLEGQVPVFVSQLYPQALSSLFVASYDSQGYGGGIRNRLHTE